jgi:hypothetical protein
VVGCPSVELALAGIRVNAPRARRGEEHHGWSSRHRPTLGCLRLELDQVLVEDKAPGARRIGARGSRRSSLSTPWAQGHGHLSASMASMSLMLSELAVIRVDKLQEFAATPR